MASSTDLEERFSRAVKTIQNLPADGIIQPSNLTKLIFYGLYKQAMQGPCKEAQPYMFNYVARAKWEAWDRCRAMSKEQAMLAYLDEIRKIVENMPQTKEVLEFAQSMGFTNVESGSQAATRPGDPSAQSPVSSSSSTSSSSSSTSVSDMDDYYDDASDLLVPAHSEIVPGDPQLSTSRPRTNASVTRPVAHGAHRTNHLVRSQHASSDAHNRQETPRAILTILTRLQRDIQHISQRLNQLETLTYLLQQKQLLAASQSDATSWWLPLSNFRRGAIAFILLWPFVAFLLIRLLLRAKIIIRFRGQHL